MNTQRSYSLTLTENQLAVVEKACDLYTRVFLGQLDSVAWLLTLVIEDVEKYQRLKEGLGELKPLIWGQRNGGPGIRSERIPDNAKVAYDIVQVVRQVRAYQEKPEGGIGFNFDPPMISSLLEKLPIITPADGLDDPRPS